MTRKIFSSSVSLVLPNSDGHWFAYRAPMPVPAKLRYLISVYFILFYFILFYFILFVFSQVGVLVGAGCVLGVFGFGGRPAPLDFFVL